jgi:hypothetical protein
MDSVQYGHVSASSQSVVSCSDDLTAFFLAVSSPHGAPKLMQAPGKPRKERCDEAPQPPKHLSAFSEALHPPQRRNSFAPLDAAVSDSLSETQSEYRTWQLSAVGASNAARRQKMSIYSCQGICTSRALHLQEKTLSPFDTVG